MPCAFDVYDAAGGQSFTTAITVNLDTTRTDEPSGASPFTLDSSDVVTIATPGLFAITGRVTAQWTAGIQLGDGFRCYLEEDSVDDSASYGTVTGAEAWAFASSTGADPPQTAGWSIILNVSDGDAFRLQVVRVGSGNTMQTIANGSALTFHKLGASENRVWSMLHVLAGCGGSGMPIMAVAAMLEHAQSYAEGSLTEDALANAINMVDDMPLTGSNVALFWKEFYRAASDGLNAWDDIGGGA